MKKDIVIKLKTGGHTLPGLLYGTAYGDPSDTYRVALLSPPPADLGGEWIATLVEPLGHESEVRVQATTPGCPQALRISFKGRGVG